MMMLILLGCNKPDDSSKTPLVDVGEEISCEAPVEEGPARFAEEAVERGLDLARPPFFGEPTSFDGSVAAGDLDGDGDLDLVFGKATEAPDILLNDGNGYFTLQAPAFLLDRFPYVVSVGLADLTGDRLPELLMVGLGGLMMAENLGGGAFAEPEVLWFHEGSMVPLFLTYGIGDMDGDGDLDFAIPGLDWLPPDLYTAPEPGYDQLGTPVILLENQDGRFVEVEELTPEGTPGFAMYAIFTDRDQDGDEDLLVSSVQLGFLERLANQAFYRRDAGGWQNDAPEIAMDLSISGMGGEVIDLNGDGILDYCFTDTGPVKCMVNDRRGAYYDVGISSGLIPAGFDGILDWSAWSMEAIDFDNDGLLDMAMSAGDEVHPRLFWPYWTDNFENHQNPPSKHVDTLFWGDASGIYQDVSAEIGFDTEPYHYGLVSGDFDGDGFWEIVMAPPKGRPHFWQNRCGEGAWLDVELIGPADNSAGFNAVVEIEIGGTTQTRQITALRGFAQSGPSAHFGLGDATGIDRLTVYWPGGESSTMEDLGVRRKVKVYAP